MATPAEIMSRAASLMNDTARSMYTDEATLPYLNMALDDLQEIFEQNNIPVTDAVSTVISAPAGTNEIAYPTLTVPTPALPLDLVEIQRLWESASGTDTWVPMTRRNFLPHYLNDARINQFLIWTWQDNKVKLIAANADNDLKLDYIKSIFPIVTLASVNFDIPIKNVKSYLSYRTASLCSMYIGENPSRADALAKDAQLALDRTLSVPIKGGQAINTRRRPFRSAFKRHGWTC